MRKRRRAPVAFIVINTGMLWLTTAIGAAALWPIYESMHLVLLVFVVLVVGSAVAILGAVLRLPSPVVLIATLASYLLLGVPLAVPGESAYAILPTGDGLLELVRGTAFGWKQLLTITLPVGDYESLLVPAFILVLLTVVIGLSVALRAKNTELAVIAPVVLFLTAVLFGRTTEALPLWHSLALLVMILIWLMWLRWYRRRESIQRLSARSAGAGSKSTPVGDSRLGSRAILGAVITMAAAAAVAVVVTTIVPPSSERQVLRTSIEQPFDPRHYASPLSGFRAYHQEPMAGRTMFTVQGLPAEGRIRIATLDTYDGIVYSVGSAVLSSESGSFTRVPTTVDQSAVVGESAEVEVVIDQYEGVWVPTIGKLKRATFTSGNSDQLQGSFFYNDVTGTAAVLRGLRNGDSYSLQAVVPTEPTPAELRDVEPGTAEVPPRRELPEEVAATLTRYVGATQGNGERLQAMLAGLRADGYISHGVAEDDPLSRSGHAADRISELLSDQRMIGDQEQYAVTAALMAGELGFPARVVVGFFPEKANTDGVTVVRGDDISAWIEVNTTRDGWIPIDPTPPEREIPAEEPEDPAQVARPQSPVQPPIIEPDVSDDLLQPDSTQDAPELPNELLAALMVVLRVLGWTLIGAAIVLAPFLAIVAAKVRRRILRRRARSAAQRIAGGWREFVDAVVDHGYSPPPSATRTEVAETIGGLRPLVLASVVDRAVFSPERAEDDEADQVWESVAELRKTLAEGTSRWHRIRALVSIRSLGGYSVRDLFKR